MRPILTEENKWVRMEMAWHFRDCANPTKYQDMHDKIHLDEKWYPSPRGEKPKMVHQT